MLESSEGRGEGRGATREARKQVVGAWWVGRRYGSKVKSRLESVGAGLVKHETGTSKSTSRASR